jgi:2'-5' RNA ligase
MKSVQRLYFLALMPEPRQQEMVTGIKQHLATVYGLKHALKSPPHITLYPPFLFEENREPFLLEILNSFKMDLDPFLIRVGHIAGFPPRVIYLDISKSKELITLQHNLEVLMDEKLGRPIENKHRSYRPHMTLATRVREKKVYRQVWEELKTTSIGFRFLAEEIYLLKHNNVNWEIINKFSFTAGN